MVRLHQGNTSHRRHQHLQSASAPYFRIPHSCQPSGIFRARQDENKGGLWHRDSILGGLAQGMHRHSLSLDTVFSKNETCEHTKKGLMQDAPTLTNDFDNSEIANKDVANLN